MSITVAVHYRGEEDKLRAFAREMLDSGAVEAIRQEPGNLAYTYFLSFEDPQSLLLFDSWKDQASLDAHHTSPMMQTIMELREKYGLTMRADRYVSDQEGFTERDNAFMSENS